MKIKSVLNHKFLLNCCNFVFLLCGATLILAGFYLFSDNQRILLSRLLAATSEQLNNLPQPLFYYISLGLASAGTIAVLSSIIGFWASCLNTYCFLSIYFITVVILLLAESTVFLAITLWPHCLGLNFDNDKLSSALQANYGIPGREQFTIGMDLAQVKFGCCGMTNEINYDLSMWRLQGFGQKSWTVPLSCCLLSNSNEKLAYLDPQPKNVSQCQALQKFDFTGSRHTEPCLEYLDLWYREQYAIFLGASLIVAIVEFCVLLSIVLNCTKISGSAQKVPKFNKELKHRPIVGRRLVENIYEPDIEMRTGRNPGRQITSSFDRNGEIKGVFVQPQGLYENQSNPIFKPKNNHYHISRSYLV